MPTANNSSNGRNTESTSNNAATSNMSANYNDNPSPAMSPQISRLTTPLRLSADMDKRAEVLVNTTAPQIQHSFNTYQWFFNGAAKLTWQDARQDSTPWLQAMKHHVPQYLEEFEAWARHSDEFGISVGGRKVDALDYVVLNARSEILSSAFLTKPECTTIGASRQTSALFGETWDWFGTQRDALTCLRIENASANTVIDETTTKPVHNVWTITEGGMLAKIGMNSAGLFIGMNFLSAKGGPTKPSAANGWPLPVHVMYRLILDTCATVDDVIDTLREIGMAGAVNMPVGDSSGRFEMLECMPGRQAVFTAKSDNGWVLHTNHCLAGDNIDLQGDLGWYQTQSETRLNTARRLTKDLDALTAVSGDIESILRNTDDGFYSICHAQDESVPEFDVDETVIAVTFESGKGVRRMRLAPGRPDIVDFQDINLD